jgi:putative ABC transport system permease protein
MITDYFNYAFKSLKNRGIRSWLTMLGIFVGIATVVSLISLGQGLKDAMNAQFEMMGTNIIYIAPGSSFFSGMGGSAATLTDKDKAVIEKVRGVELVGGIISKVASVRYKGEVKYTFVSGLPTDKAQKIIEDMQSVRIDAGRKFNPSDRYVAIIGHMIAEGDLFKDKVDIGDKIEINDNNFRVIGAIESLGNHQDDTSLWIPLEAAKEIFNTDDYYALMARVKDNYDPNDVAEDIKEKLRKERNVKKGEEDFIVQTSQDLMESVGVVLSAVQWFLIGISAISLLVGAIGIMNTMYTSVLERTREIGVMKAVGAKNSDITTLFLIESGVLGMVGGLIGCVLGIGLSKTVEFVSSRFLSESSLLKAYVSWELFAGALLLSFIVGCASGVLPARQAAGLKPVDALRYE